MKDYRHMKEKLVLSELAQKLCDTVRPRLRGYVLQEGTHTGPDYTGHEPFLDTFEQMPDSTYAQTLATAIVRSWLESPVVIHDEDILVGVPRPDHFVSEHFSWGIQYREWYLEDEAHKPYAEEVVARVEKLKERMFPMDGHHTEAEGARIFGLDVYRAACEGGLWGLGGYQGHTVPGYPLLLRDGFGGTAAYIRRYMANTTDEKKLDFYQSLLILLNGFRDYAHMYADAAEKKAKETGDLKFMRVAENCRAVAWDKPKTLYQAAQLMWFYSLFDWVDCIGRLDQYMYPFYKKAVEEGDVFDAEDIIAALILKVQEHGVHNLGLGGVKPEDGSDATNDLTFLILQLARTYHQNYPRIQVRINKNAPKELMELIVRMWSDGMSDPTLVSDELVIPGLVNYGVMLEDARDYTTLGCQEIEIPGKSNFGCEDGVVNLAKIFEYTINNGCDRNSGVKIGLDTGCLTDFHSMDELWAAFKKQIEYFCGPIASICSAGQEIRSANLSKLVKCLYTEDCIARGIDHDSGGTIYNYGVIETAGTSAVGDSLTAIDKLVFREKRMTMEQLKAAIDANFEGYERERMMLLNMAPKFGNDDDLADEYTCRVLELFWSEMGKYKSVRGGAYMGACSLLTGGIWYGSKTWAMPDGRKAGDSLGNTMGPRTGADKNGVTAMLKSVMKLPLHLGVGGTTLNVLLPRVTMETEEMRDKVETMMTAFMMGGGQMAQITTASLEDMRDAQAHPELHKDLNVRVGGYSAKFIEVDKETQDEIMRRYGGAV